MRRPILTAGLFLLFLGYAILRYVVFAGVPASHIPVYVTNKAVAWLAVVLVGVSMGRGVLARRATDVAPDRQAARRWFGLAGYGFALLHVLLTVPLFTPAYYGKFFATPDGSTGLTLSAELSLLAGALATVLLVWQARLGRSAAGSDGDPRLAPPPAALRRPGWAALVLAAAHCTFMGWAGWGSPSAWPGGLPPITLLAVLSIGGVATTRWMPGGRGGR